MPFAAERAQLILEIYPLADINDQYHHENHRKIVLSALAIGRVFLPMAAFGWTFACGMVAGAFEYAITLPKPLEINGRRATTEEAAAFFIFIIGGWLFGLAMILLTQYLFKRARRQWTGEKKGNEEKLKQTM